LPPRTLYQLLGVPPEASAAQLKQAYRRLAQRHHPDHDPDPAAAETFKAIAAAYRELSDPDRRAAYDRGLGLRKGSARAERRGGADLLFRLDIGLRDVVRGARVVLEVPRHEACPGCEGDGCPACRATGRVKVRRALEVRIPQGVEDDSRIRLRGEGDAGAAGGTAGDLLVAVRIKQHPLLKREGATLTCELPVPAGLAALGGEIEVPVPEGRAALTLPAGIQSGTVLRLRGKGLPRGRGKPRGDLLVTAIVETPARLTSEGRERLKELDSALGEKAYPKTREFRKLMDG